MSVVPSGRPRTSLILGLNLRVSSGNASKQRSFPVILVVNAGVISKDEIEIELRSE